MVSQIVDDRLNNKPNGPLNNMCDIITEEAITSGHHDLTSRHPLLYLHKRQRDGTLNIISNTFINPLQPSGHYMYHQFSIQQFYVLSKQCIWVFCVDLRTNSDYLPIQH